MKRIQSKENGTALRTGRVPGCYESPSVLWAQSLDREGEALCASNTYGEGIDWGDDDSPDIPGYGGEGIEWE